VSAALTTALLLVVPVIAAGVVHQAVRARGALAPLQRSLDDVFFGGRLVFGKNKTLRGFVVVPVACAVVFAVERATFSSVGSLPWWTGSMVGAAYVLAELPNSFAKRRAGIAPGGQARRARAFFFALDHLDSALGCALAFRAVGAPWSVVLAGLILAPALHVAVNLASHAAGLRSAAW
jgi:hypothetical protein